MDDQTFGVANDYDGFNSATYEPDGLLGLGFKSISQYGANQLIENLYSEGLLDSPIFGFNFGPSGAEFTFGGVDSRFNVDEDFTWIPLTTEVCQSSKCV